jgi:hypothetical protein
VMAVFRDNNCSILCVCCYGWQRKRPKQSRR